jgi:hypothetical protein
MGGSDSAALGFAQGETQMIVMFGQQLPRVPGIQPAEQHQDRGAAVLMAAGQRGFASLRVQSVAAMTIAICRSAQCELSACTSTRRLLYTRPSRMASPVVSMLTICRWAS